MNADTVKEIVDVEKAEWRVRGLEAWILEESRERVGTAPEE